MNLHSAPQDVPQGRSGKAGRRLGPIAEGTGPAHRAWLEPLRDAVHGRGVTLDELQARTGRPKGHISELLRAVGRYPRWVFVRTVLLALDRPGLPYDAMRLRWVLAARDVGKRTSWIKDCLHEGGARHRTATASVPLDFLAFQQMHRPHYTRYASAFLRRPGLSKKAVDDVFTLLLMLWHDALASENPERFAWPMLRQTVLERAPKENGRPSLVEAAFDTVALDLAPDPVRQVEESMALFRAVGGSRPCSATSWSCCTCAEWRTPGRRTNWASPSPPYGPPHGTPSATCTPPCTRTAPPRRGSPVTSTIDQLLARARLHTAPYAPADIADTGGAPHPQGARGPGAAAGEPQRDRRGAARDLQALCETAVTRTAVVGLGDFLTHKLPQPSGARVLGCILLLTDAEDSARFWWQYAAGAGDSIASYCLYLHHLALGENHEAVWWRSQSAPPAPGTRRTHWTSRTPRMRLTWLTCPTWPRWSSRAPPGTSPPMRACPPPCASCGRCGPAGPGPGAAPAPSKPSWSTSPPPSATSTTTLNSPAGPGLHRPDPRTDGRGRPAAAAGPTHPAPAPGPAAGYLTRKEQPLGFLPPSLSATFLPSTVMVHGACLSEPSAAFTEPGRTFTR